MALFLVSFMKITEADIITTKNIARYMDNEPFLFLIIFWHLS